MNKIEAKISPGRWIWIVAAVFILLFYFIFDPLQYGWMPQCIFHKVTGLQCMGCGSQRVIHSLLHGDISGALRANALLTLSRPFLCFMVWLEFSRRRHPVLYRKLHSQTIIIITAIILLAWFVVRNLLKI